LATRSKPAKGLNVRFGLNLLVHVGAFAKKDLALIPRAAEMGFDGVEVPLTDLDVVDTAATRKACQKAGLGVTTCAILVPGTGLCAEDAAERRAGVERIRRLVAMTAEIGGAVCAGPLYAPVGYLPGRPPTDRERAWCVEGLRAAAGPAEKAGVVLAIEPINRFETYVANTAAQASEIVQAVDSPNVKLLLDTFHMNIEEKDSAAAIRRAGPLVGHFHAAENDRGVPGTGQVRWKEVFEALRAIRYGGWVVIESFAPDVKELAAAARIWRDVYPSADVLARDGLAFLKRMARSA
jgi:D-psicose/D-tagatose/L-ribulose 3-epimerase